MTLIDAVKSGRRIRRQGTEYWMTASYLLEEIGLTVRTLLATDWEHE